MTRLDVLATRLSIASSRARNSAEILWPDVVDRCEWFISPESVSLFGTPHWERLTEDERKRLSFWELVNFFSLNIHGEDTLTRGIAARIGDPGGSASEPKLAYLQHFLEEERVHTSWFTRFCRSYAGKVYADRRVSFPSDRTSQEEEIVFFAQAVLFEEIVDCRNKRFARDARVCEISRTINRLHHRDESRHLSFGWTIVEDLWNPAWSDRMCAALQAFVESTWRQFYNPEVYAEIGIDDPYDVAASAWASDYQRTLRHNDSQRCHDFLDLLAAQ